MNEENEVKLSLTSVLSKKQARAVSRLQKVCFVDVDDEEASDDFYHPASAQILAYVGNVLVGWAGVHITEQVYKDKKIKLGGYGICTHPDWRQKGIATKIASKAMSFLKQRGCDIGFLSVNPNDERSIKLHQKYGFVMLQQNFSWTNSKGEIKQDRGGMISPLGSKALFEFVLNNSGPFYVGNGYW